MRPPMQPADEAQRLKALDRTALLDTQNEERFDRVTRLVQRCLGVDIVLVSLLDASRQWFKSKQGLDVCETARDISFCGHAILQNNIFEVTDSLQDERFKDSPLVTGALHIRFYAGAPLVIDGKRIGTLCVKSKTPRKLTTEERNTLREFADIIEQEILDRMQEQAHVQLAEREMRFRSVLEGTQIGTWEWNIQTGETVFNQRWAEIVGYSLEELAPISIQTWLDLAHPDDLKISEQQLNAHFNGEMPYYDVKCRMRHKLGHWVWVHDRGRVVSWTADNLPLMMYGTHADITDQKTAEIALKESRDQYQTLVNNIPGITYRCIADQDWTMMYISGDIDPLSGYPASDFIGNKVRSYASVIHPDDHARLEQEVAKALANKQSWVLTYRLLHRDGSIRFVEERGAGEFDEQGNLCYLDGFIFDITNEERLKRQLVKLADQLPGVVYQFQQWPDGRTAFPYASSKLKDIYGVHPEEVTTDATTVFATIYSDDLPALAESIQFSAAHLSLWQHEYRLLQADGSLRWVSGRAMPERMPDNSVLWHGYIYDITNTKEYYLALERANENLKLAQQRLELSSEQAQIGYWQASLRTGSLWWSPMIYDLFGYDAKNMTPSVELFKQAVHPDDTKLVEQSEKRAIATGLHDVIHRIVRTDGEIRWVHELARMVPESDNPDLLMIGSVQDITERMRLQQMKDEFVSTVSHELRTPLTSISGALGLLNNIGQDFSPKAKSLVDVASNNTKRLLHLINDLLDIEKLIAGKMNFDIQPHDIVPLIKQALKDHTTYASKNHLRMRLVLQPETADSVWLPIDEHRLQQVLANLLSNAIKYSPTESEILLTVAHELPANGQSWVTISVADEGPGVPPAFRERLFQRFSQADGSDAREKGGTGLGLALCKELVEGMGGKIWLDTETSVGSRFCVSFMSDATSTHGNDHD